MLRRVDFDDVIEQVDVAAVADRVDVNQIAERIDIDGLVERTDLGAVIARSSGGVAGSALTVARRQAVSADEVIGRVMARVLRRGDDGGPGRPASVAAPSER